MAKPKRPAGKQKGPPSPEARRPSLPLRLLLGLYRPSFLFPAAVSLALIVTWPYLAAWTPDLRGRSEFVLSPERIVLPPGNEWVPSGLARRVLQKSGISKASLLDDDLAERLARAFAAEPWVKQVRGVRKHRGGRVTVDLVFRRPVLMAAASGGMYPIDDSGVLLPPVDFSAGDISRFPIARNVRSLPSGPPGQAWGDPIVEGAARLAAELHPADSAPSPWERFRFAAILLPTPDSASPGPEELSYQLETRGGSRIVWGQAPGKESLEPPTEVKLERLAYYLQQCGSFETAAGPSRIDITGFDVIRAESLQGAAAPSPTQRR
jgi:hypothetical protein